MINGSREKKYKQRCVYSFFFAVPKVVVNASVLNDSKCVRARGDRPLAPASNWAIDRRRRERYDCVCNAILCTEKVKVMGPINTRRDLVVVCVYVYRWLVCCALYQKCPCVPFVRYHNALFKKDNNTNNTESLPRVVHTIYLVMSTDIGVLSTPHRPGTSKQFLLSLRNRKGGMYVCSYRH